MKVYDLKGVIVDGTIAVIAVSLPKENDENKYSIKAFEKFDDNGVKKLRIHLRDIQGEDLTIPNNTNFVSQIIDLSSVGFKKNELTNSVEVVLHHIKNNLIKQVIKVGTGTIKS